MITLRLFLLLLVLLLGRVVHAADEPSAAGDSKNETAVSSVEEEGPEPASNVTETSLSMEELSKRSDLRIGNIFIDSINVFDTRDPKQNNRLYRLANRLHMVSREGSLRNQLLIEPGDLFSVSKLEESERVLRARPGLYDAEIEVVAVHDGVADIAVHTRDVWTLNGGFQFGRSGGENRTSFTLKDKNFLGLGKRVNVERSSTVDRTTSQIDYDDPNLAGTRNQLSVSLADNSDGQRFSLRGGHPFYALDSRWALSMSAEKDDRIDRRYLRGDPVDLFRHDGTRYEVAGGLSKGLRNGRTHRLLFGVTYQKDLFSEDIGTNDGDPVPSGRLPDDRVLAYPWIGYEFLKDSYVEETNLDRIDRTEDRYRGLRASARLGFSSSALGGDRSQWVFEGVLSNSWILGNRQLVDVSVSGSGRYGDDGFENSVADVSARYYLRQGEHWLLFVRLAAETATKLDFDQQLLLGGENGLRGYPLRYQDGDRRFLFTVEERLFTDWQPFNLFHVGAAAFVDVGRAWFEGEDNGAYGGMLANAGVGLRFGNTRAHGSIVHVDLAFPLGADPSIQSMQWLVSTRHSF